MPPLAATRSTPPRRQDAAEPDIVQAVLQAAYLRQLLGVPPAGSRHPVASAADDRGSAVDVQQAVTDSGSKARGSLKPFISQVSPCSLHSTNCWGGAALPVMMQLSWCMHALLSTTTVPALPACSCRSRAGSWRPSC